MNRPGTIKPSLRRSRQPPEERRRQIVEAATTLIAEAGFNAVSTADIASACGVSKSLILYYFPSMDELLVAVLEYRDARAYALLSDIGLPPKTPAEVRKIALSMIDHSLSYPGLVRLYHILASESLSPRHPAHDYFAERASSVRRMFGEIFSWRSDPDQAALTFIAFFEGVERLWLRDPSINISAIAKAFVDGFIR